MAKISTYVIDGTIVDGDKVIGSDANNSMQTKNYTIGDLVGYFAASIGNDYLVPYVGANDDVDLGAFNLSAGTLSISENFIANGTAGLPGQALLSQGPGSPAIWGYVVGSQDLASVLSIGNVGDLNINLINTNGYAKIDIQKLYGEPAMYLHSNTLGTYSNWGIDKLHLESTTNAADYTANKIRYLFGGNYVDIIPNSYNNQSFILPAVGGFVPVSVNGNFADASGNITVSTGGVTGSGVATRVAFWGTSTSLSSNSLLYWDNNNERLGVGTSTPEVRLHVGDGGGAMGFPYEEAIVEKTGDTKFGVYTSVSDPGDGGASYTLGYTNLTTNLGFYPGFEYQLVGNYNDADNFIRFNFLGRNSGGFVTYAYPNIFNLYADGRASFRTLIGTGTRMVTTDQYGFIGSQAIPTGGGGIPHATASGTDTYTATVTGVTSYADGDAYLIRFTNGNTTGATLNINGLGAIPLYRNNDGAVIGGDIIANAEMLCVYNSSLNIFQTIGTAPNTLLAYVTNDDSVTITKGQVVYAFGGQGDRLTVKLANNTSEATSAQTVGVVMSASIGVNQKGFIITQGLLDGLSILPTSTFTDGDPLYLGATAGSITRVKPSAPNHLVYLGNVTTASPGAAGRWYVRVQNGYELQELHNVAISSVANNDGLFYESSTSLWKNKTIAAVLGYTPQAQLNGTGFVKVSGTTISYDNSTYLTAAITSLNSLTGATQTFTTGTSGTDFGISSVGTTHTFNIPDASTTARGLVNTGTQTFPGNKSFSNGIGAAGGVSFPATVGGTSYGGIVGNSSFFQITASGGATLLLKASGGNNGLSIDTAGNSTMLNVTATSFVKSGGTSSQFLKANGSVDSNTYLTSAITSLNALTGASQTFATDTTGTDFAISSSGATHTFSLPTASATNRGALSSADWTTFNSKQGTLTLTTTGTSGASTLVGNTLNIPQYSGGTSYTFSTGLTNSANTITNNLSTGVAGGQSVVGGTAASNSLTLSSTSNATKGKILFGTSAYDEVNNRLGIATNSPSDPVHIELPAVGANSYFKIKQTSTSFSTYLGNTFTNHYFWTSNIRYNGTSFVKDDATRGAWRQAQFCQTTDASSIFAVSYWNIASNTESLAYQVFGDGNFTIGGTIATNTGYKLDVNGTARVQGALNFNPTNTAAGTTGNQTINKASGTVNIAAAGTTVTVTNSLVTTSSIVFAVIRTNDATATIKNVVPASGSFTINLNAATTAETSIGFFVIN